MHRPYGASALPADHRSPLQPGAIARVLETDHVTAPTRRALIDRLNAPSNVAPQILGGGEMATLQAVCNRLIPQPGPDCRVPIALEIDGRLAERRGDGWRYDALPPDQIAIKAGLSGIEQTAKIIFNANFAVLEGSDQDAVLASIQQGSPPGVVWASLNARLFFAELLASATEVYFSHPFAQERIGYIGMADVQGFHALGLNVRDPIENEVSLVSL